MSFSTAGGTYDASDGAAMVATIALIWYFV